MSVHQEGEKNGSTGSERSFATAVLLTDLAFVESRILRAVAVILLSLLSTGLAIALGGFLLWLAWLIAMSVACGYGVFEAVRAKGKFDDLSKLRADLKKEMEMHLAQIEVAAEGHGPSVEIEDEIRAEALSEVEASRSLLRLAEATQFGETR
jgi:hypothetical protein